MFRRPAPTPRETGRSPPTAISRRWASASSAAAASPRRHERRQLVALINEEMARRYWAGRDPLGGRMKHRRSIADRPWVTVVGIVGDVRHNGITDVVKEKFYVPHTQWHKSARQCRSAAMTLVVKTSRRSAGAGGAGAAGDPRARPDSAGRRRPHDGRRRRRDAVDAAIHRHAARRSSPRSRWCCRRSASTACCRISSAGARARSAFASPSAPAAAQVLRMVLGSGLSLALTGVAIGIVLAIWRRAADARACCTASGPAIR